MRHLFAALHVRWLSRIFNCNACVYQTTTRWDLPSYRMIYSNLQHQCQTRATQVTRMQHECDTNDTSVTRVLHERHECDTTEKFWFDNHTSKNIFSHHCICYMASERLQGEEQFHSKNYFLEIPLFHAKMRLKGAPQKLKFLIEKATSKSCTLDCSYKCPCTFPHSYAQ